MQTDNRDLFVSEASRDYYADILPLIDSPVLGELFSKHDKAAMRAKAQYNRLGQLAIVLIALSAIYTIAESLVLGGHFGGFFPTLIAALMAGTGVILQIYLLATKQKTKWLVNRFAAERLRSVNFQAFALAASSNTKAALKKNYDAYVQKNIAKLENELNAGIAVLKNFSPSSALDVPDSPGTPRNAKMTKRALEAYHELRVSYQRNFALARTAKYKGRRRLFNSTQDMIYLGAACFACLSLGAKIAMRYGWDLETAWIDFIAVTLFIIGATEAIMDNATLEEQSQTRFEQYVRDIDEVTTSLHSGEGDLVDIITKIERVCLEELDHFCRAADRISYRF